MERIKQEKQPNLILCADLHLRETVPVCRTDDFIAAQWRKMDFIKDLQKRYSIPVLCGGDIFDHWKPSPFLLSETMKHLPDQFFTVLGNHDLPQHALSMIDKCGVNVLKEAGKITILNRCHFGQEPTEPSFVIKNRNILVWHQMVWQGKKPYPTCTDDPASTVLKKYPQFDLILCGDNHKTFCASSNEIEYRWLVNPGSLMRMDADQIDHKPSVFLWYASDNTVQQVFLPIEEGVVSRTHLEQKEERDGRIDAFVSKLNDDYSVSLSFEDNLTEFMKVNKTDEEVKKIIYTSIE
jgi:DNA repair exonuclease SbcCD nuclease subunit